MILRLFIAMLVSGTASACVSNCVDCRNGQCRYCAGGYYLSFSICIPCGDSCSVCKNTVGCVSCNTGFYLSSSLCTSCIDGCDACTNSNTCDKCKAGYRMDGSVCAKCIDGCDQCSDSSTCDRCKGGYFKMGNTCFKCGDGCDECGSQEVCDRCLDGYYIYSGACKSCQTGCATCYYNNGQTVCKSCLDKYYLKENKCVDRRQHDKLIIVLLIILSVVFVGLVVFTVYYRMKCIKQPNRIRRRERSRSTFAEVQPIPPIYEINAQGIKEEGIKGQPDDPHTQKVNKYSPPVNNNN